MCIRDRMNVDRILCVCMAAFIFIGTLVTAFVVILYSCDEGSFGCRNLCRLICLFLTCCVWDLGKGKNETPQQVEQHKIEQAANVKQYSEERRSWIDSGKKFLGYLGVGKKKKEEGHQEQPSMANPGGLYPSFIPLIEHPHNDDKEKPIPANYAPPLDHPEEGIHIEESKEQDGAARNQKPTTTEKMKQGFKEFGQKADQGLKEFGHKADHALGEFKQNVTNFFNKKKKPANETNEEKEKEIEEKKEKDT
eukprot:TRINITY_DN11916_c0_g1_i1.p1 TRINITY_DN11916_c0_g1~~TRINITY_DN11916_c0_g1_i1.p1  ORF type:complete len:250 (+),score=83.14 TRINITY_DN11916_c0_g1_i1:64-813(+)